MSDIKIIHVKRQKLIKHTTKQWCVLTYTYRRISRTNTEEVFLNVKEVKYTKTSINLLLYKGEYYYSDTFNEYYKTLSNERKRKLDTCIIFENNVATIIEPLGNYFISDWGKVNVND